MKRWLGLFAILVLAGAAAWFVARQMEPLESRFSRVQVGMSRAEAEAIMGRGQRASGPGSIWLSLEDPEDWGPDRCLRWVEQDTSWIPRRATPQSYWVRFDADRDRVDLRWTDP